MGLRKLKELMSIAKEGLDKSFMVARFFCALHVINAYLCTPALGPSMLPTFSLTGDLILAERISTRFGKVVPGDIVLVRSSENPRKIVAKRVKGMEGDSVTYVVDPNNSDRRDTFVVPKGHVWIEGDNIYASNDSRKFGAVPYGLIQSRVFWRLYGHLKILDQWDERESKMILFRKRTEHLGAKIELRRVSIHK
ncbi:unnamed protein product [Camellia sinensis]